MNGIFITGTGTGIGKTALAALLLAEFRRRGTDAVPMKPVQTGCAEGADDLGYALSMARMEADTAIRRAMAPYRFEPPCSPHLAASMAGTEVEISELVIAARTLAAEFEFIIAEGAGGVLVPLNHRETMLDLMQAFKLPVVLVADPGLGTINHTLLSIRALRSDGLPIAGVVFAARQPGEPGLIEEDNAATIELFGKVPVLGTIPYCAALATATPVYSDLPIPVVAAIEKIVNRLAL